MTIKIIIEDGVAVRTSRVEAANIETHIAANDRLANEARVLQAFCDIEDPDARPTEIDGFAVEYVEGPQ